MSIAVRVQPGEVRDAIISFFRDAGTACSLAEIQQGVRARLGDSAVKDSSVRSYLNLNTPGVFERVSRGRYRLAHDSPLFTEAQSSRPQAKIGYKSELATLFIADCFEWLRARKDASIDAIVTDPPYGVHEFQPEQIEKLRNGSGGNWRIPPSFDGVKRAPLPRFTVLTNEQHEGLEEFFFRFGEQALRALKPGGHVFIASNPLLSYLVANAMVRAGFENRGSIVRLVMTMRGGDRPKNAHKKYPDMSVMPRSKWEPWLLFRKQCDGTVAQNLAVYGTGALRRPDCGKPFADVIHSHPTRKEERALAPHPSLKPQAFMRQIVRASLPLGKGIVLDPFAGSGSTLAAAEHHGYESIGIELDPQYARVAKSAIPKLANYITKAPDTTNTP